MSALESRDGLSLLKLDPTSTDEELTGGALKWAAEMGAIATVDGSETYALEVRLSADPARTHGVGANLLHIDYVAHACPPSILILLCLRHDPLGGGATRVSAFGPALACMSARNLSLLSEEVYAYFPDSTGAAFGALLPRFSLRTGKEADFVRFTGKLISAVRSGQLDLGSEYLGAVEELAELLNDQSLQVTLQRGDLIAIDQRKWAHGRTALGPSQHEVPVDVRRLLVQCYVH